MARILLVEDDVEFAKTVQQFLQAESYLVDWADNGDSALKLLSSSKYDATILDWGLPDLSGLEIVKRIRAGGSIMPMLFLTGRQAVDERITGLDAGADDYVTKPVHMAELSARVRALLRRQSGGRSDKLEAGSLALDPRSYRVTRNGEEIRLSAREFELLEFLMRNPNEVFSNDALLDRVWSADSEVTPDAVRVCVKRIRQKLGQDSESIIETVHGIGYRFSGSR
jgi:DNA-binding response OmpR family regulator